MFSSNSSALLQMHTRYTAEACRLKYANSMAPWWNHATTWSRGELLKLALLVLQEQKRNDDKVDWERVAARLGTRRSPWCVFRKWSMSLSERALLCRE